MSEPNAARRPPSDPAPLPALTGRSRNRLAWIVVLVIALVYGWFLTAHGVSYASGSDASGYFNSARLLAQGKTGSPLRTIAGLEPPSWNYYFQQPLGFMAQGETGLLIPTYPVGLPLQLLVAEKLVGWGHAAVLVNVLSAVATGWLTLLLGRQVCGLRWPWALTATALIWACPLMVFFSLQPMSDVPATAWTLGALYAAFKVRQNWRWGFAVGTAVGMAVLLRPTNILVMLPVLLLLGGNRRGWVTVIAAGLPFAAIQAIYNHTIYGHVLTSGYGDVSPLLQSQFVPHNLGHFARWIPQLLTPLVLLTLALPWVCRRQIRSLLAGLLWVVALIGFYAFYYHSGETWWYLRFILPVFPCLLLAASMVAQRLTDQLPSGAVQLGLISIIALFSLQHLFNLNRKLDVTAVARADQAYFDTMQWLQKHAPANAVMAAMQASGALQFYTSFPLLRYDLMSPAEFAQAVKTVRNNGQAIYAPLFPFEIKPVVDGALGGHWQKIATIDYITIWRLQP
ncbi:MAG: glycosyltransferase family 39 protein [Cephaloticoccus sp.]|nr:glycosyltransferase family 39 protein [Cephaloticoccus sp.]